MSTLSHITRLATVTTLLLFCITQHVHTYGDSNNHLLTMAKTASALKNIATEYISNVTRQYIVDNQDTPFSFDDQNTLTLVNSESLKQAITHTTQWGINKKNLAYIWLYFAHNQIKKLEGILTTTQSQECHNIIIEEVFKKINIYGHDYSIIDAALSKNPDMIMQLCIKNFSVYFQRPHTREIISKLCRLHTDGLNQLIPSFIENYSAIVQAPTVKHEEYSANERIKWLQKIVSEHQDGLLKYTEEHPIPADQTGAIQEFYAMIETYNKKQIVNT